jgi:NADH-quinone oxidoreductase subunit D
MNQEHAWCLAIEKLDAQAARCRAARSLIRVLYSEIGRILNHLLNVTTQAMDVGALTPPLWGFEEREKLMIFYERACGARLHAAYFRPGGVHQDLPPKLMRRHRRSGPRSSPIRDLDDLDGLLTENRIFKQRNVDIGVVSEQEIAGLGLFRRHGARIRPCLGPAPCPALRAAMTNSTSSIPVGKNGDCYDRYLCRMEEMRAVGARSCRQALRKAAR